MTGKKVFFNIILLLIGVLVYSDDMSWLLDTYDHLVTDYAENDQNFLKPEVKDEFNNVLIFFDEAANIFKENIINGSDPYFLTKKKPALINQKLTFIEERGGVLVWDPEEGIIREVADIAEIIELVNLIGVLRASNRIIDYWFFMTGEILRAKYIIQEHIDELSAYFGEIEGKFLTTTYISQDALSTLGITIFNFDDIIFPTADLSTVDNMPYDSSILKDKYVLLKLVNTTSGICNKEKELIKQTGEKYLDYGLITIFLFIDEDIAAIKDYVEINDYDFQYVIETNDVLQEKYSSEMPVYYFLDRQGYIIAKIIGNIKWDSDTTENILNHLLSLNIERYN
jgi:hypothetical protein